MPRRRRPPRAGALNELPPMQIAAQIATLQGLFYAAALVLMLFTALVSGNSFSLDLILGWDRLRGDTTQGWLLSFVWLFDGGFCMAVAIVVFVARSKLVPDFALTVHFLHLLLTALYSRSLPRFAMWWATMLASSALAVGLGIWGCRYRELQPVFFGGGRILGAGGSGHTPQPSREQVSLEDGADAAEDGGLLAHNDEEMGYPSRGRGRGRGRDVSGPSAAGEYEMSRMSAKS
jgi:hypothetical protein